MTSKPNMSENPNQIIEPRMLCSHYDSDDEISLVDLWISLVNQKIVFFITFLIITGLGLFFSLIQPDIYEYSTTIDIGTRADKETLIQPVETVKSEITSAYINQALHEFYKDKDKDKDKDSIIINVSNPKETSLIILKSSGPIDESDAHLTIQNNILQRLIAKHNTKSESILEKLNGTKLKLGFDLEDITDDGLFETKKLVVENTLNKSLAQLRKLRDQRSVYDNALVRFESLRNLLQTQYKNDKRHLELALKNLQQASKTSTDTSLLILLTSELQQYRTHIASLDERLNIKIPTEIEEVRHKISNNQREQMSQKNTIQQAQLALTKLPMERARQIASIEKEISKVNKNIISLPTTHAIVPPSQSFKPINSNKNMLIIVVSTVLGLFIGIFAALFSNFLTRVEQAKPAQ